ncbi:FAD-dependent monooxygenase [Candidatus Mycobacterium methanotrophicum]|uniref:FAD-dependent monooxygenase n=1 Tax=Candidatus Mycobacterium methanotrophicum TaxID=2943498 RepID=UPI00358DB88C
MTEWKTTCLVVGGGPAGMMLGYLLARSGVETILVEKHGDFLRDFRGDTVHPSTTELMHELGILDEFLRDIPHQTMEQLGIGVNGQTFDLIDFRHMPTACKYVVFMPQWDFLNFLADKAKRYPSFRLEIEHRSNQAAVGGRSGRRRHRANRDRATRDSRRCDGRLRRKMVGHPRTIWTSRHRVSDADRRAVVSASAH